MDPQRDLITWLSIYEGARPGIRSWLERTYFTTFGHGGDLVHAIAEVWPADAGYAAEQFLTKAEAAGWLKREKRAPQPWQSFAGVGGASGKAMTSATIYGWSPVTTGLASPISRWLGFSPEEEKTR